MVITLMGVTYNLKKIKYCEQTELSLCSVSRIFLK